MRCENRAIWHGTYRYGGVVTSYIRFVCELAEHDNNNARNIRGGGDDGDTKPTRQLTIIIIIGLTKQ